MKYLAFTCTLLISLNTFALTEVALPGAVRSRIQSQRTIETGKAVWLSRALPDQKCVVYNEDGTATTIPHDRVEAECPPLSVYAEAPQAKKVGWFSKWTCKDAEGEVVKSGSRRFRYDKLKADSNQACQAVARECGYDLGKFNARVMGQDIEGCIGYEEGQGAMVR